MNTPSEKPQAPSQNDTAQRSRPRLLAMEKFDGKDCLLHPQFEGLLCVKIDIDGDTISGEKERVWYAFNQLSESAAQRIYPWISYAQKVDSFTLEGLLELLKIAVSDPKRSSKALAKLNRRKQGTQPLNDFLNIFNRWILEAEGWRWRDRLKKGYLKAALSTKLLTALVGIREEDMDEAYCSQLRQVNDQPVEIRT
ncbi:hypothetical protein BJ878DRAFT_418349 [Calycina marina]|uniref:Uncharacterized protein n=1 Tax=Calycina marina TaxID=1763456 RepID=A0A9P7Z664_9HELO|nr:hypothetical protein BJ878DRAFT_418349 [Calycina marina]